jgi:tetratricopeptide (TPR) repeat protein
MLAPRRARSSALIVAAACLVALLVGAQGLQRRAPVGVASFQRASSEPMQVEFAGCAWVARGPTCAMGEARTLRLWIAPGEAEGRARITIDGALVRSDAPTGDTIVVDVPSGARSLALEEESGRMSRSFRLALDTARPRVGALVQARAERQAGRLDAAQSTLTRALEDASPDARGEVLSALARVEYARGLVDAAAARFDEAIARHEADGHDSEACDDAFALAFMYLERHRISEVRAAVRRGAALARDYADGRAYGVYYDALIAAETGDRRTALRRAREAAALAGRLGNAKLAIMARDVSTRQLAFMGRYEDAVEGHRALVSSEDFARLGACDRGDMLDNLGFSVLLLREHAPERVHDTDARSAIEQALTIFGDGCPDPNRVANALANQALADLQEGRLDDARDAIGRARRTATEPPTPLVLFAHDLEGRLAFAANRSAAALAAFEREVKLAAAIGGPDDEIAARQGLARVLAAMGRREQAISELDRAEALVDTVHGSIPLGEGREAYLAAREGPSMDRVALLIDAGRPAEGLRAARRARARLLAGVALAQRLEALDPVARSSWEDKIGAYVRERAAIDESAAHDWGLAADKLADALAVRRARASELRSLLDDALGVLPASPVSDEPPRPRPGELVLAWVPVHGGWIGFADDGREVKARTLPAFDAAAPPAKIAQALLEPLHDAIAAAQRIRVTAEPPLGSVDLHALPFEGAPLLAHAPVVYGLDLRDSSAEGGARRAVIVADPTSDLTAARVEADRVRLALAGAGGLETRVLGGTEATSAAVRDALASADLVHYAGHGAYGGRDAVDSALPLANGGTLTLGDVLALTRVPATVVLFGCETAKGDAGGARGGLGLAQAFVAAGARSVVATPRTVADEMAADLAGELYRRLIVDPRADVPRALQGAELALAERRPDADWSAFRVLTP